MTEFVGLLSKLLSFISHNNISKQKCKGLAESAKKSLNHQHFLTCLLTRESQMREIVAVRSDKHEVFGERINRVALLANDDKRVIQPDGISTYTFGNHRLQTV